MREFISNMSETTKGILIGLLAGVAFAIAFFPPCGALVWRLILWMGGAL